MSDGLLTPWFSAKRERGDRASFNQLRGSGFQPHADGPRPAFVHIVECHNAAGLDVWEEIIEISEHIFVDVGPVDVQQVNGLIPGARRVRGQPRNGCHVFGEPAAFEVVVENVKIGATLKRGTLLEVGVVPRKRVDGENVLRGAAAAVRETTSGSTLEAADFNYGRAIG